MTIGTTFHFTQNHHCLESSVKSPIMVRMSDFSAKTACATFVTDSECKTTRNINSYTYRVGFGDKAHYGRQIPQNGSKGSV